MLVNYRVCHKKIGKILILAFGRLSVFTARSTGYLSRLDLFGTKFSNPTFQWYRYSDYHERIR